MLVSWEAVRLLHTLGMLPFSLPFLSVALTLPHCSKIPPIATSSHFSLSQQDVFSTMLIGLKPKRTVRVVGWVNEENGVRGVFNSPFLFSYFPVLLPSSLPSHLHLLPR